MRIRTLGIMHKFLKEYLHLKQTGVTKAGISMDWKYFFSRAELEEALRMKFHNVTPIPLDFSQATSEEMLIALEDDSFLLQYFLLAFEPYANPNDITGASKAALDQVLLQLNLETHFLAEKNFNSFDEYDLSNMRSLFKKAGWMKTIYAVVGSEVEADDYSLSKPPKCYFDNYFIAQDELMRQIKEDGFANEDLKMITRDIYYPPF